MDIFIYILIGLGAFAIVFVVTWLLFGMFGKRKDNPQPGQADMELMLQYVLALQKEQPQTPTKAKFAITRQDIVDWIKTLEETDITVKKRTQDPQMPYSLRWKDKTFALAYGTEVGVLLIVRIQDTYAKDLAEIHRVDRSTFPKGPSWWAIPLDHTWTSKEMVLNLLESSITYVKTK